MLYKSKKLTKRDVIFVFERFLPFPCLQILSVITLFKHQIRMKFIDQTNWPLISEKVFCDMCSLYASGHHRDEACPEGQETPAHISAWIIFVLLFRHKEHLCFLNSKDLHKTKSTENDTIPLLNSAHIVLLSWLCYNKMDINARS